MFRKVLIANRGEIACRIIRTCRSLGIATVAVYSDVDARAQHVVLADEAVALGGATPAQSYLRGDAILAAAVATGAEAIHPGYGFLSENPDFVDQVVAAGLVFVGPSAQAIRAMGLKDAAKALMEQAGVPVVPGYHGADQSDAVLAAAADRIGYPVLIKAVAGGGGKGMRLVEAPGDFAAGLASARREAAKAFGNADMLVEKYITAPRHIEVQVFGDAHGNVVHLYERDCSLQRRHQKVIEEAPAPGMTDVVRDAMTGAAMRAAQAIGYHGAGTVEFIVDGAGGLRPDGFWFMEMNTRLQVEHPVTEAVLGLDLVAWQLQVAAGAPLPLGQADLALRGHAVEARLYAEDPGAGFLPAIGHLDRVRFSPALRVDSGVCCGDDVSPYYDPMIAKLIAHGPDRTTALARLRAGLVHSQIAGVTTNKDFLVRLLDHPDMALGQVETGLIGRHAAALSVAPAEDPLVRGYAALCLAMPDGPPDLGGRTLWGPIEQQIDLDCGAVRYRVVSPDRAEVECGTSWHGFDYAHGRWRGPAASLRVGQVLTVFGAETRVFTALDPLDVLGDEAAVDRILAPMPGLLTAVDVAPGQTVSKGDRLAVLEAMKMEHVLTAGRDGVVEAVLAQPGQQVQAGQALIQLAEVAT